MKFLASVFISLLRTRTERVVKQGDASWAPFKRIIPWKLTLVLFIALSTATCFAPRDVTDILLTLIQLLLGQTVIQGV
jgi:hypothetical protein